MRQKLILCVSVLFLFAGCQKQTSFSLPQGAIPIVYRGHIYIQGSADSIKGNFVFDTGASNLYYDSVYYSNNDFNYANFINALLPGAGKSPQNVIVIMDTVNFSFGKYLYQTPIVPVLKLKPILGDFSDGIIGLEYFSQSVLEINYQHEYINLYETIDSLDITDYKMVPLTRNDNRLYLPLRVVVNDSVKIEGNFQLDFGSGGSISLLSLTAKKFNLDNVIEQKAPYFTKYGGVGGESSSFDFMADSFQIADFVFNDVTMDYSTDKSGAMASNKHFGLLGNEILDRFDILLDLKNNNLYLKANNDINKPFEFSRLGFSYVDRNQTLGAWIVTGLYKNSYAEKQGLKIDDEIISLNGISVSEILYESQKNIFKNLKKVELEVKRNETTLKIQFLLKSIL